MAVISSLSILLKARTDKFRKSMGKAVASIKRFGSVVLKVTSVLAGLFALMAGAGAFSLKQMFAEAFSEADKIGKMSDEIGSTVDQMFTLQHAAEITGTTMDVMVKGLQRMNRRIGEAANGYGEAVKGIEALGMSMDDLLKKDAFGQFLTIAEAMKGMKTQAQKAAAVYTLFGRQGQMLLNTFELGEEGLKKMADEVKYLMGSFDRDEFRVFEEMNDNVVRLKMSMKGFVLGVGKEFSQFIGATLTEIVNIIVTLRTKYLPGLAAAARSFINVALTAIQQWAPAIIGFGQLLWSVFNTGVSLIITMLRGVAYYIIFLAKWHQGILSILGLNGMLEDSQGRQLSFMELLGRSLTFLATALSQIPAAFNLFLSSINAAFGLVFTHAKHVIKGIAAYFQAVFGTIAKSVGKFAGFLATIADDPIKALTNPDFTAMKNGIMGIGDTFGSEFAEATKGLTDPLSFQELLDTSGATSEAEGIVKAFRKGATDRKGMVSKLSDMIDRIKNFKLGVGPVRPSKGLEDVATTFKNFGVGAEFGSQAAASILSRRQIPKVQVQANAAGQEVKAPVEELALWNQMSEYLRKIAKEKPVEIVEATI